MEELFQVVVFVLIAVGWVIKTIAERKKAAQQQRRPPPADGDADGEVLVDAPTDTGREPPALPPRPTPRTTPRTIPQPTSRPVPASPPHLGALHSGVEGKHLAGRVGDRHLQTRRPASEAAVSAIRTRERNRRLSAVRRLTGGLSDRTGRKLTRAGVLWSEVLAAPRAVTGPHRTPTAKRLDRP